MTFPFDKRPKMNKSRYPRVGELKGTPKAKGGKPVSKPCQFCGKMTIERREVQWNWMRGDDTNEYVCPTCAQEKI